MARQMFGLHFNRTGFLSMVEKEAIADELNPLIISQPPRNIWLNPPGIIKLM